MSLIAKILHEVAESPDVVAPDVSPAVSAMVMQLLAKNAEERIQSRGGVRPDARAHPVITLRRKKPHD
jgi:hypothetical protein